MSRRDLIRIGAGALTLAAALIGVPAAAPAQTSGASCEDGIGTASISIDSPAPGATVSGVVVVRGTASAPPPLTLNRVEVTLGRVTNQHSYATDNTISFSSRFDTSAMDPGPATLSVTACSTGLTGVLARADQSISVTIQRPTPTTSVSSTTAPAAGARTEAAAVTTTAPAAAITSTTAVSVPPTTEPPVDVFRPEPVKPKTAGEAPLILTETPVRRSPRPPLWVGAVVGLSGALGLGFSAASWRRRAHPPDHAEPIDPDLVEVG